MRRYLLFGFLFLLLIGSVSAHRIYLVDENILEDKYSRNNKEFSGISLVDNSNRFPVSDYRHGYTYRVSKDYRDRHSSENFGVKIFRTNKDNEKSYRIEYIPFLKTYEKIECYHSAPTGKLFYIRC